MASASASPNVTSRAGGCAQESPGPSGVLAPLPPKALRASWLSGELNRDKRRF